MQLSPKIKSLVNLTFGENDHDFFSNIIISLNFARILGLHDNAGTKLFETK